MQAACETLEAQARDAHLTVSIDAPPDLPPVNADRALIERVLVNLLDNAIRYTPHGGRIHMSLANSDVVQTATVANSGERIPSAERERIFERFVQLHATRPQRGSKGSGLGLTFCRLAVEAHGGRIWVDDAPDGGAAFHFTLPAGD
jgi:two-component system clock-associated histidine kinase SasA